MRDRERERGRKQEIHIGRNSEIERRREVKI